MAELVETHGQLHALPNIDLAESGKDDPEWTDTVSLVCHMEGKPSQLFTAKTYWTITKLKSELYNYTQMAPPLYELCLQSNGDKVTLSGYKSVLIDCGLRDGDEIFIVKLKHLS